MKEPTLYKPLAQLSSLRQRYCGSVALLLMFDPCLMLIRIKAVGKGGLAVSSLTPSLALADADPFGRVRS